MLLRGPGDGAQHREIPEQKLEQQRQVANGPDIDAVSRAISRVGREPRNAMMKPRTVANTQPMTATSSVQQTTTNTSRPWCVGLAVVDQRLIDAEAGRIVEEAEAAGEALGPQVVARIDSKSIGTGEHQDQGNGLIERAADLGVVVDRHPRRSTGQSLFHRIGGAY